MSTYIIQSVNLPDVLASPFCESEKAWTPQVPLFSSQKHAYRQIFEEFLPLLSCLVKKKNRKREDGEEKKKKIDGRIRERNNVEYKNSAKLIWPALNTN